MDYATIKPAIQAWVADVTSLNVYWRDSKQHATQHGSHILLDIPNDEEVGYSITSTYDNQAASGEEITKYHDQWFTFVLEIQAISFRKTPGYEASYYTNLIRSKVRLTEARSTWKAATVSFARILNSRYFSTRHDGRMVSYSTLELSCNGFQKTASVPNTYIETAELTSNLLGPDGNPLDFQSVETIQVS